MKKALGSVLALVALAAASAPAAAPRDLARYLPDRLAGQAAPSAPRLLTEKRNGRTIQAATRCYGSGRDWCVTIYRNRFARPDQAARFERRLVGNYLLIKVDRIEVQGFTGFKAQYLYQGPLKILAWIVRVRVVVNDRISVTSWARDDGPALDLVKGLDLKGLASLK
jgi:hypothetical protein